jgi:hypothetical protein
MLPFRLAIRFRAFTLPPTSSTFYPQRPSQPPPPTSLFLAPFPPTLTYRSSDAPATRTPLPLPPQAHPLLLSVCLSWLLLRAQGVPVSRSQHEPPVGLRHVVFDESSFPFASYDTPHDDLESRFSSSPVIHPIAPPYPTSIAGTLKPDAVPHMAPTPQLTRTRGPSAPARTTCALGLMIHRAPLGVPAMTSGPHTKAFSRQVIGLPPHHRGS